jgi:hypothetical protein
MGRIAVRKDVAKYFADEANRRQVDEYLDWINPPRGRLTPEQRREWIVGSAEASCTQIEYVNLIERIWMAVWLPPINRFIRSTPLTPDFAYLHPSYPYATPRDLYDVIWASKTYERDIWLPIAYRRRSQQTSMRASVMTDIEGRLVLSMAICRPTKIRRLTPPGWTWSETSDYQCSTPIKLTKPTRNLNLAPLQVATEDAVKAVADFHLHRSAA